MLNLLQLLRAGVISVNTNWGDRRITCYSSQTESKRILFRNIRPLFRINRACKTFRDFAFSSQRKVEWRYCKRWETQLLETIYWKSFCFSGGFASELSFYIGHQVQQCTPIVYPTKLNKYILTVILWNLLTLP